MLEQNTRRDVFSEPEVGKAGTKLSLGRNAPHDIGLFFRSSMFGKEKMSEVSFAHRLDSIYNEIKNLTRGCCLQFFSGLAQ
jgi:hypothetical protein